jgi:uncharacterized protein YjlB
MNRKKFLSLTGLSVTGLFVTTKTMAMHTITPEVFYFKDDGRIPNSKYPLLVYRQAFTATGDEGAGFLEKTFAANNWSNSWRNGIYPFHHYHSISHEVLGIYSGSALLHLGGENGKKVKVQAGDIIVIPAGVGHKNLGGDNLGVVGAYPDGHDWDLLKGEPGDRPQADKNIAAVPFPSYDPLSGKQGGLLILWPPF